MHSLELRCKAVIHYKHFLRHLRKVARIYGISKSSLQRWVHMESTTATLRPRARASHSPKVGKLDVIRDILCNLLASNPFATAAEVAQHLKHQCGLHRSPQTAWRWLRQAGMTRKKAYRQVDFTHDPDHISSFCKEYLQRQASNLVCIDETGFYLGDCPRFGYSPRGKRLAVIRGKSLRCSKISMIMAVGAQGVVHFEVLDGNCRKDDFVRFVKALPVPPGSTLLMDNIAFHHSKETLDAIRSKLCTPLFTPPYSPRFNPIEQIFAAVKAGFRKHCPCRPSTGFDYENTLLAAVSACDAQGFHRYFQHTRKAVEEALAAVHRHERVVGYG